MVDESEGTGNVQGKAQYKDWEGNMHDTQDGADAANAGYMTDKAGD